MLPLYEAKDNLYGVESMAQAWMTFPNANADPAGRTSVAYASFNTPIDKPEAEQCGRGVFSDLHVSAGTPGGLKADDVGVASTWPTMCAERDLSAQEKALEFLLFDLTSCVSSDKALPPPPR